MKRFSLFTILLAGFYGANLSVFPLAHFVLGHSSAGTGEWLVETWTGPALGCGKLNDCQQPSHHHHHHRSPVCPAESCPLCHHVLDANGQAPHIYLLAESSEKITCAAVFLSRLHGRREAKAGPARAPPA